MLCRYEHVTKQRKTFSDGALISIANSGFVRTQT